jgi:hypothetical protein
MPDVSSDQYFGWDSLHLQPGDYVKLHGGKVWGLCAPNGDAGTVRPGISGHKVVEHEDETITISPSIWFKDRLGYHGYLKRGVWSVA